MYSSQAQIVTEAANTIVSMNTSRALIVGGMALLQMSGFGPVQAACDTDFTGTCPMPYVLFGDNSCSPPDCTEETCCEEREKFKYHFRNLLAMFRRIDGRYTSSLSMQKCCQPRSLMRA